MVSFKFVVFFHLVLLHTLVVKSVRFPDPLGIERSINELSNFKIGLPHLPAPPNLGDVFKGVQSFAAEALKNPTLRVPDPIEQGEKFAEFVEQQVAANLKTVSDFSKKVTKGLENGVKFLEACYKPFGCFSSNRPFDPFNKMVHLLPLSPEEVDLTLFMFDKERSKEPEAIKYRGDTKTLEHLNFNREGQVKFIVHGWGVNIENQPWMTDTKNLLLENEPDCTVFLVDWRGGSGNPSYPQSAVTTKLVAKMVAHFIKNTGISPQNINIIGHSLGGHISGLIGYEFPNPKISKILALDAAGPWFDHNEIGSRLDKSQADYVEVLYTNAGTLGLGWPIGHVNIYPHGGSRQPGCELKTMMEKFKNHLTDAVFNWVGCHHGRSCDLAAQNTFHIGNDECEPIAYACSDINKFEKGFCTDCGERNQNCQLVGIKKLGTSQYVAKPGRKFFILTKPTQPFCLHHYGVEVTVKKFNEETAGNLKISIPGLDPINIDLQQNRDFRTQSYKGLLTSNELLKEIPKAELVLEWKLSHSRVHASLSDVKIILKPLSVSDKTKQKDRTIQLCARRPTVREGGEPVLLRPCSA
ncbi:lipoprotein lipase-like [Brevipalpus obovatus]|uniref:lipoprotein lipase-like n=1 Tax=Brevipalpus obovatus TaxID=246614 RepID=UPI003D9F5F37